MLTTEVYREGDRVRVTVEGEVGYVSSDGTALAVRYDGDRSFVIRRGEQAVTVERLAPDVVPGRLYADRNGTVVYAYGGDPDYISVVWPDGTGHLSTMIPRKFLPLTQVWPPPEADSVAVAGDISWPPKRAGLDYGDCDRDRWRSIPSGNGGLKMQQIAADGSPFEMIREIDYVESHWGPMRPIGVAPC